MQFMKWQGAGNDFILMDASTLADSLLENLSMLAQQVCDRHFGIGADGLMVAMPSEIAAFKMVYYNSDGSYATMCGNGLRCFSAYCVHIGLTDALDFLVETGDGIKKVHVNRDNGYQVTIDMGTPIFEASQVPTTLDKSINSVHQLEIAKEQFTVDIMRVGVPHAVVDLENRLWDASAFKTYGTQIEKLHYFPEGTNVNFVRQIDKTNLRVDTWERGAGLTLACGTGVCASAFSYYRRGLVELPVQVEVAGGTLTIDVRESHIIMTGPAVPIAAGEFYRL